MNQLIQKQNNEAEGDPLILWVAYIPDGEKKRYLSNGTGGVRVFKSEDAIREYLGENMTPLALHNIVVHSITGEIVVPVEESETVSPIAISDATLPISTLASDSAPTATEILADTLLRRNQMKKGNRNENR